MNDRIVYKHAPLSSIKDPLLVAELQRLRQTDNITNVYYLARTWFLIAAVIGSPCWRSSASGRCNINSRALHTKHLTTRFSNIGT
jgi:hypothetical protein